MSLKMSSSCDIKPFTQVLQIYHPSAKGFAVLYYCRINLFFHEKTNDYSPPFFISAIASGD